MAVGILGGIVGSISFLNSVVGEAWTRYFLILGGLVVNNAIGLATGLYAIEALFSLVISNVFGLVGFTFPVYYGVSSLLLLFVMMPLLFFLIKMATSTG